jgi:hypothetical protein
MPATVLLKGESLCALRLPLHLEALAAEATLTLDLEGPAAATVTAHLERLAPASAAAATAHLERLAAAATASLTLETLGLAATVATATATRPGFGIVIAMSAAAGLGCRRGCDRQRRNAGRQE